MRKQYAVLFIPVIPTTALAIHSSTSALPSQRSHERIFLKNFKGSTKRAISVPRKSEIVFTDLSTSQIDAGFHAKEFN